MMQVPRSPSWDEYQKLLARMVTPRVRVDSIGLPNATRVMIDCARADGILLEAVQVITDLDLSIVKGYVSSDGMWFMDVFHVIDEKGNKLKDEGIISRLEQLLATIHCATPKRFDGMTALELTGTDRVGLLSEVFAVLSDLQCNVVEAKVWTHNGRIASLIYIKDCNSNSPIDDFSKIDQIKSRLSHVLRGDGDIRSAKTAVSLAATHAERRLHQMMYADRDYDRKPIIETTEGSLAVSISDCSDRGYSVVNVQCNDRRKLLFDLVCTLTDMEYVIYHANISTNGGQACLDLFVKHVDGNPIKSEAEKQRLNLCLQAAIKRRASEGVCLELCMRDRPGLLAEAMRIFRENALNVSRAEISTTRGVATNVFHVTDAVGNLADPKVIESVRQRMGTHELKVREPPLICHQTAENDPEGFGGVPFWVSLGRTFRRNLYEWGIIKSSF